MNREPGDRGVDRELQRESELSVDLPADQSAPADARRALEPLRDSLSASEFVDVRLLVSELVVDELRGRGESSAGTIRLSARLDEDVLRIEVAEGWDPGSAPRERPKPGDPGWGIYLAQLLGDRWGVDREDAGARIWVEKRLMT